jgi:predicted transposase/invertase (TIGR01784 family)
MAEEKSIERLDPLNDYLFLKMMGEKGDEEQLLAFINAVLKRTGKGTLQSVKIVENKKLPAAVIGDKNSILDVRAIAGDGSHVNIEVQLRSVGNMARRMLYYWSRDFSRALNTGQDYAVLPKVIAICILDEELFPRDKAFHTSFHLREDVDKDFIMTDAIELHFIDMVKFRREQNKDIVSNRLHRWMTFFDWRTEEETIKQITNMDTAIKKAHERMEFVASNKKALRAYEMRQMAMSDYTSGINNALRKGERIGLRKGRLKGRLEGRLEGKQEGKQELFVEMVRNMKAAGVSLDLIQACTGLSFDEIERICNS